MTMRPCQRLSPLRAPWISCLLAIALGTSATWAKDATAPDRGTAPPIAREALAHATMQLRAAIERGSVAGAAHLVLLDGEELHLEVAGVRDVDTGAPFTVDTIVRVYSMTKPITSVAAMRLFEDGKFDLDDPVGNFIPAFSETKVLERHGDEVRLVPAKRPITVRDVLRHTTGYSYGAVDPSLLEHYEREGMRYHGPAGMFPPRKTIRKAAESLARIPAIHHPGERFTYGFNTDLLGRLIEVWSGMSLDRYLDEAIFSPLGMVDTGFSVPLEKRDRLASCHTTRQGALAVIDAGATSPFRDGFDFVSGGGGLLSTIRDYGRFCRLLVDGGVFGGHRLLRRETLDLMFTDQLEGVGGGLRFGLGFAIDDITIGSGEGARSARQYSWSGYASTTFVVVPSERLAQVVFRQHVPFTLELSETILPTVFAGVATASAAPRSTSASEEDWTGWLGPRRDGRVRGFRDPVSWPERLTKRWSVEVGAGYGSPLVVDGRVYQHARQGDDEVLWCLDLGTGAVRWRKSWPVPFRIGSGGERHGKGPKSSPTFADGRVFTMSITGVLSAWGADGGELLWRRGDDPRLPQGHPYWGASTSPIVEGRRVIAHFGTDEAGSLVALDVETGEELWRHGDDGPSYSSPLVVEIEGVRQVVEWNHRALVGVDIESGRFLWEHPFPHVGSDQNMPTPAIHEGLVLLGGENRGIFGVRPRREGESWSVTIDWHQKELALDMSSAVVHGDRLFGFSHYDRGRLFCLEIATGEVLWKGPPRTGDNVMLLTTPKHVLALIDDGELQVIQARGDRLEQVASYEVSSRPTWAPPVLLEDTLLVKDLDTLSSWRLETTGNERGEDR